MFNGQKPSIARFTTFAVVLAVHIGVIFIPLGVMLLMPEKPKQIAFRVKLGGSEPSHAPELGPPERIRPTGNTGSGTPPPPPPPEEPLPPPLPELPPIPKPEPKPQPKPDKPKPLPKPKPKPLPKPKPKPPKQKPKPKPKIDQKKIARERWLRKLEEIKRRKHQEKIRRELAEKRRRQQQEKLRRELAEKRRRQQQQQIHHDKRWDNWDPNKPTGGGTNTNIAVPIGTRDRGQALGKVDNRTPAGGATIAEEKYWQKLDEYFRERWQRPAGIFVSKDTGVIIEVSWDSRGKVLSKRIIKASPNAAVTQSVKLMLDHLDYVPAPPAGIASSVKFNLVSE